ncbi:ATP-binding protein [Dysgonomonas sp. 520]|uniref:ATP-binding protein n=1 Tax=Dysgonomonas sp. 520 TaxID=2302931 RepID=UPI00351A169E
MEAFFRTHRYLVEHLGNPVERQLMNEINWDHRLIAIKGTRGVGKTTFLLQYARRFYDLSKRDCLYINMNNFSFTCRSIYDFAEEFYFKGGKTLLIDQVFKYPNWAPELRKCYEKFPDLKIVFTVSTVMRLGENPEISTIINFYNLRGFSFREFLNIITGSELRSYTLTEILASHREIATDICARIKPLAYFRDYIHHGYYPFFLEKRNFSENLLKTINMMLEVDVLSIRQIEQSYLSKIRKLLYLLSLSTPGKPNISQLSIECEISRATVTNYLDYLKNARLINLLYREGEEFPKKPDLVYMHNTNLIYAFKPGQQDDQILRETFFYNQLHHNDSKLKKGSKAGVFAVENQTDKYIFRIDESKAKSNKKTDVYTTAEMMEIGEGNTIPLWLFGFLY